MLPQGKCLLNKRVFLKEADVSVPFSRTQYFIPKNMTWHGLRHWYCQPALRKCLCSFRKHILPPGDPITGTEWPPDCWRSCGDSGNGSCFPLVKNTSGLDTCSYWLSSVVLKQCGREPYTSRPSHFPLQGLLL